MGPPTEKQNMEQLTADELRLIQLIGTGNGVTAGDWEFFQSLYGKGLVSVPPPGSKESFTLTTEGEQYLVQVDLIK